MFFMISCFLLGFFPPTPNNLGNVHYPLRVITKNGYVIPEFIRRLVSKESKIYTSNWFYFKNIKYDNLNDLVAYNLIQYYIVAISSTSYLPHSTGLYGFREKDTRTNSKGFSNKWPISCKKERIPDNTKESG